MSTPSRRRAKVTPYMSAVEKQEYDCKKQQTRNLLAIYYSANNIQGTEETEEADPKAHPLEPHRAGYARGNEFLLGLRSGPGRRRQMNGRRE